MTAPRPGWGLLVGLFVGAFLAFILVGWGVSW